MAAITHSASAPARAPVLRLGARFARLKDAIQARRERVRQMQELATFSDRDLWDVGLSRSDFMAIERGIYRRD